MRIDGHKARCAALAADIYRLDAEMLECRREACSPTGTESEYAATVQREAEVRLELDRKLVEYFISAQFLLSAADDARRAA